MHFAHAVSDWQKFCLDCEACLKECGVDECEMDAVMRASFQAARSGVWDVEEFKTTTTEDVHADKLRKLAGKVRKLFQEVDSINPMAFSSAEIALGKIYPELQPIPMLVEQCFSCTADGLDELAGFYEKGSLAFCRATPGKARRGAAHKMRKQIAAVGGKTTTYADQHRGIGAFGRYFKLMWQAHDPRELTAAQVKEAIERPGQL